MIYSAKGMRYGHLNCLLSIIFGLVKCSQAKRVVCVLEIPERNCLLGIPCRERWTTEALSKDLIPQSESLRIEVQRKDATLCLAGECDVSIYSTSSRIGGMFLYLDQV